MNKILYIAVSSCTGGAPKHILDILKRAGQDGFEIMVAVPSDGDYYEKFLDAGAHLVDLKLKPYSITALWKLQRLIRRENIDLVHSHGKGAGMYARPLGFLCPGLKVVHTFHGIYLETYGKLLKKVYCLIEHILKNHTDVFICVSESEKKEALRLGFCAEANTEVISNGVEADMFRNAEVNREKYLKEFGFPKNAQVVGCIARFDRMKGHGNLLRAFQLLHGKMPQSRLLLVGDGPDREEIERIIREMSLEQEVFLAGFRHDIPQILNVLDVFVSASLKEGMPYTLIEALAAAVPVVATDVIGNRDVILDQVCGVLVPPEKPEEMADALEEMIRHPELGQEYALKGRKRVEENFTAGGSVKRLFDIYRKLIK